MPKILPLLLLLTGVFATGMISGCEKLQVLHNSGIPGMYYPPQETPEEAAATLKHREQFLRNRDHRSLYWLLSNRISNGMSLNEAEEMFGEPGERETDVGRFKADGLFQSTDLAYKWGPDSQGHSVILFFRDGCVVNFNPKDYKLP